VGSVSGTACTARGSTCCTGSALRLSLGGTGGAGGTGGGDGAGWSAACGCAAASGAAEDGADGAGSPVGSGATAACGIAADSTGGADSWCRSRMGVPTIPAASTGPKAMIHFCMCATVAPARGRGQSSPPQPASEDITREMKPSIDAGSIQRSTATMPVNGSIQVELPPAPLAKTLTAEALG